MLKMWSKVPARLLLLIALLAPGVAGCQPADQTQQDRPETSRAFPLPHRPVARVVGNQFSTEDARDNRQEAEKVMDMAGIEPGMTVADIGAGNGYYTVRLARRVGESGRVLAEDIDSDALKKLGARVERERFDNVSIKLGTVDNPRLPEDSFDRVFLVHMYHEVSEPYAFLWRLWPSLNQDGQVIVVDVNRPTNQHGIPPKLLFCEFEAVGYKLLQFEEKPDIAGFFARFARSSKRPEPSTIKPCQQDEKEADSESDQE